MEIIVFLSIVIAVVAVLTSIVLVRRVKKQIAEMTDVLVDVKNGNGNRRILSATNELTAPLAYEINEIVVAYESRLSTVRQTEETNRQLMTSLSHDVRTPLTTLIGYLDAAHKGLVTGKDRDDYIETARRKAHDLKEYIDVLFDWFKLNSDEFALEIQSVEAAELTRNILIDWITMRILSIIIFVIVYGRMIEIYCMVSLAPIPMATFGNHEQSHMGQNYLKCLFALGFQGFLILICVAIYAVLIQNVAISGDAINSIWSIVGYTVLLCFSLFKTSSVTKSVLGAH